MLLKENGDKYEIKSTDQIVFWGASSRNREAIEKLGIQKQVLFFVDSNIEKNNTFLDGYAIKTPQELHKHKDIILITVLYKNIKSVIEQSHMYDIDLLLFLDGDDINYRELLLHNRNACSDITRIKYVHFIIDDKFFYPFYKMINDRFDITEHFFVVIVVQRKKANGCYNINSMGRNTVYLCNNTNIPMYLHIDDFFSSDEFKTILRNSKEIYLHSAWSAICNEQYINQYLDKTVWLVWGGDAHFSPDNDCSKNILRRVKKAYCLSYQVEYIRNRFGINAFGFDGSYFYYNNQGRKKSNLEDKSNRLNILLGHSGDPVVNHTWGLLTLLKYKGNIRIISPLCYGVNEYINIIKNVGNSLFGDCFVPITEQMTMEAYYDFLNTIDVAVFPLCEMKAYTTINYLNAISVPIFMNPRLIEDYEGIEMRNIYDLEKMTFDDLFQMTVANDKNEKRLNLEIEKNVSKWKELFS